MKPTFRPVEPDDRLLTWGEFIADVNSGCLTDYDGYGELATETAVSDHAIYSSFFQTPYARPAWATHVVWYNR